MASQVKIVGARFAMLDSARGLPSETMAAAEVTVWIVARAIAKTVDCMMKLSPSPQERCVCARLCLISENEEERSRLNPCWRFMALFIPPHNSR